MNNRNAVGFLSFGLVMGLMPVLQPTWFPATGLDGTSTRALWLEVMGVVQTLIGSARVVWHVMVPAVIRWLAFTPSSMTHAEPAMVVPFKRAAASVTHRLAEAA